VTPNLVLHLSPADGEGAKETNRKAIDSSFKLHAILDASRNALHYPRGPRLNNTTFQNIKYHQF